MKTRVVRHWNNTDWVFSVESHVQAQEDTPLYSPPSRYGVAEQASVWKKGEWRWQPYIVSNGNAPGTSLFSRDRATLIAARLAEGKEFPDRDVVEEFGS